MTTTPLSSNTLRKACVLVVDDHPTTAVTLARALSKMDPTMEVISANSGHDALRQVRNKSVDVLITDMMMVGMNGLELIEELRKQANAAPLYTILITAYDVPGLKESARRMNVDQILIKPVHPEQICQVVQTALSQARAKAAASAQPHAEAHPTFRLLVADDNTSNLTLLARYLEYEGFNLIVATDGQEALSKARAELPDLLLLDVNMPYMDGFQVLKELRADPLTEHIPVIILTAARLSPADMQHGFNLGADDYVLKPFDRRELLARIRSRLRVKEAEDRLRRRNRELNLLPEIARTLSMPYNLNDLAETIIRRTTETIGAFAGRLIILEDGHIIHKTHTLNASVQAAPPQLQPDVSPLLANLRETQQGFVISDTQTDTHWGAFYPNTARAAVIAPILGHHDLIGALILVHEQPNHFTQEHLLLVQAIASQAAIAIENLRLQAKQTLPTPTGEEEQIARALKTYQQIKMLVENARQPHKNQAQVIIDWEGEKYHASATYNPAKHGFTIELQSVHTKIVSESSPSDAPTLP